VQAGQRFRQFLPHCPQAPAPDSNHFGGLQPANHFRPSSHFPPFLAGRENGASADMFHSCPWDRAQDKSDGSQDLLRAMASQKVCDSSRRFQVPLSKSERCERGTPVPLGVVARELPGIASIPLEIFSSAPEKKSGS